MTIALITFIWESTTWCVGNWIKSPRPRVIVSRLHGQDTVLSHAVPLSTQDYKWVQADCWSNLKTNAGGCTCKGSSNTPSSCFMLQELKWNSDMDKPSGSSNLWDSNRLKPCESNNKSIIFVQNLMSFQPKEKTELSNIERRICSGSWTMTYTRLTAWMNGSLTYVDGHPVAAQDIHWGWRNPSHPLIQKHVSQLMNFIWWPFIIES